MFVETLQLPLWAVIVQLYSAMMVIEQQGFFNVTYLLWRGTSNYMIISEGPWHGEYNLCVNESILLRLGYMYEQQTFHMRGKRFNQLRHRRGKISAFYPTDFEFVRFNLAKS